ncbi:hypothetical protein ABK040_008853 [Willaertia magna]
MSESIELDDGLITPTDQELMANEYEENIKQLISTLQNYFKQNNVNKNTLEKYFKLINKLKNVIHLLEINVKNNQLNYYKKKYKYFLNKYYKYEKYILLQKEIPNIDSDSDLEDNNNTIDDEDEDIPNENQPFLQAAKSANESLNRSLQLMNESEMIGVESLKELKYQKEKIERSNQKLRNVTNVDLKISDQLLNKMIMRKYILIAIISLLCIIVTVLLVLVIYVKLFK